MVQAIQKIIVLREGNPICAVHYQDRARARQQRHGVFEIHDDIASMLARGPRHKHLVEKHAAFGREHYRHDVRILSELVRRLAIAQKQNVAVAAIELEQGAQQAARVSPTPPTSFQLRSMIPTFIAHHPTERAEGSQGARIPDSLFA